VGFGGKPNVAILFTRHLHARKLFIELQMVVFGIMNKTTLQRKSHQSLLSTMDRISRFQQEIILEWLYGIFGLAFSCASLWNYGQITCRIIEDGMRSGMERGSISSLADHTVAWHLKGPPFDLTLYVVESIMPCVVAFSCACFVLYYLNWKTLLKTKLLQRMPRLSQIFALLIVFGIFLNLLSVVPTSFLTMTQESSRIYIEQNDPGFQFTLHFSISSSVEVIRGNQTNVQDEVANIDKVFVNETIVTGEG